MSLLNLGTSLLDNLTDTSRGSTSLSNKIKKAYSTNFDLAGTFEVETFKLNTSVSGVLDGVANDFSSIRSGLSDAIGGSGGLLGSLSKAASAVGGVVDKAVGAVKGAVGTVTNAISGVANTILGAVGLDFLSGTLSEISKKLIGAMVNLTSDTDLMGIIIKSVNVQAITSADLQEYMGGAWVNSLGRTDLSMVTFTFYDVNGAQIYNLFKSVYNNLKFAYPDDQKWTIKVRKRVLYENRNFIQSGLQSQLSKNGGYIINTDNAILFSIGDFTVDQSNNGLCEFSVTFKYNPFPTI